MFSVVARRGVSAAALAALALVIVVVRLGAQSAEPRIWQGVYSEAQATRGREVFTTACLRCHGADLAGTTAPALKGDRFYTTFGNEPIDRLFLKIRDTMPPSFGTILDDQAKLDVVTYILQTNGYPAGPGDLRLASEDLATVQILKKGEQAVVQNFSLVQAVGCLARGADNAWMLTRSTDPVSTREEAATPQALASAANRALGTRTFRLLSVVPFKPEAHIGHKMEARGLVYTDGPTGRLSVTSLQMAAESCGG
jgi:S-disulfanyl-L-cysteine oxidoreductase SoxD